MIWRRGPVGVEPTSCRLDRGVLFFALCCFLSIAAKKMVFAQRFFMEKNDRSNIFCCILQLVMNKYCLNQLVLLNLPVKYWPYLVLLLKMWDDRQNVGQQMKD